MTLCESLSFLLLLVTSYISMRSELSENDAVLTVQSARINRSEASDDRLLSCSQRVSKIDF